MKIKIILLSIFILLNSLSALSKAEIIKETLICCKSQLSSNRKDAIGLMLLHFLATETSNNRDVILLQAKINRGLDIKSEAKGDLLKLNKLYEQAAAIYIRAKSYKKAAYYLTMAEKLNPLSDNALINQHLLIEKGFKTSSEQLLGPYGNKSGKSVLTRPDIKEPIKLSTTRGRFKPTKLPVNTSTFKIEGHYYALILEKITWKEAKVKAESFGGYLACITSKDENETILKVVKNYEVWIGGTDEIKEGSFKWMSGEQFSYSHFDDGEPNNSGRQGEDYLVFLKGEWNDKPGENQNGYIVEWDQ